MLTKEYLSKVIKDKADSVITDKNGFEWIIIEYDEDNEEYEVLFSFFPPLMELQQPWMETKEDVIRYILNVLEPIYKFIEEFK